MSEPTSARPRPARRSALLAAAPARRAAVARQWPPGGTRRSTARQACVTRPCHARSGRRRGAFGLPARPVLERRLPLLPRSRAGRRGALRQRGAGRRRRRARERPRLGSGALLGVSRRGALRGECPGRGDRVRRREEESARAARAGRPRPPLPALPRPARGAPAEAAARADPDARGRADRPGVPRRAEGRLVQDRLPRAEELQEVGGGAFGGAGDQHAWHSAEVEPRIIRGGPGNGPPER